MTIATDTAPPIFQADITSSNPLPNDTASLSTVELLKQASRLAQNYFLQSEQRYKALLLLAGIVISIVALVAFTFIFTSSMLGFWLAFETMNATLFLDSLATILATTIAYTALNCVKSYLMETLIIDWRQWLTKDLLNKYTNKQYVKLSRLQFKNVGQRIQEDIESVVRQTITLSMDILQQTLTVAVFIGSLWVAGGPLSFTILGLAITIPGYLVWAAILFTAISALITQIIGQTLTSLTNKAATMKADFRQDIEFMDNHSESIAMRRSEGYHQRLFTRMLDAIGVNSVELIWVKTKLAAFQDFYMQISWVFPYVIAAPQYFAGKISMGQLNQIGYAFGQVQYALNWFISAYENITLYKTSMVRVVELEKAMQANETCTRPKISVKKTMPKPSQKPQNETLTILNLDIAKPQGTEFIRRHLNLTIKQGQHVLIKDKSGAGKSSLFKVLAETWEHGAGDVIIPYHHRLNFLSQTPLIPSNTCTLKAVLAYPWPADTYAHQDYENILRELDMEKFIGELNTSTDWSKSTLLSGGQRQRIAFAQVLLEKEKPDWLFLDEATSALDSEDKNDSISGEHLMYTLLKKHMKNTTIIGIAHGPTVARFYDRVITLESVDNPPCEADLPTPTPTACSPDPAIVPKTPSLLCSETDRKEPGRQATERREVLSSAANNRFFNGRVAYPTMPKKPPSKNISVYRANGGVPDVEAKMSEVVSHKQIV